MAHHPKLRIISIAIGVFVVLAVLVTISIYWYQNRPISVNQLWNDHRNLEGKTVTVRGDMIFKPLSDFRFNSLYLVDSQTPKEYRIPSQGFWFDLRIDGVSCIPDADMAIVTCEPFDPSQGKIFEFKGTIRVDQVGKKAIMWMSDIDFDHSRQWIDNKWEPIPLGQFIIPLEMD